jgi:hypothetical protein
MLLGKRILIKVKKNIKKKVFITNIDYLIIFIDKL